MPDDKPSKPSKERARRFGWAKPEDIVIVKEPEEAEVKPKGKR